MVKQSFISDIKKSFLKNFENIDDVTELTTPSSNLEKYAHPLKTELFHWDRPHRRYTAEIKTSKTKRRKLERKWRSNKSEDNWKR